MPMTYLTRINPKSPAARWAWSPVIVLRASLVAVYLLYSYASIVAFMVGVPIFTISTPAGWTPVWAVLLGGSATVAAIGSVSDRWQNVEKWATALLSSLLIAYIGGLNIAAFIEQDLNRQFVGVIALIAGVLPIVRFVYLAAQTGKKTYVLPHRSA